MVMLREQVATIRRAADLISARALKAGSDDARRPYGDSRIDPVPEDEWGGLVDNYLGGEIGAHCAAFTPRVAAQLAAWFDNLLDRMEIDASFWNTHFESAEVMFAYRIAEAYVGNDQVAAAAP